MFTVMGNVIETNSRIRKQTESMGIYILS